MNPRLIFLTREELTKAIPTSSLLDTRALHMELFNIADILFITYIFAFLTNLAYKEVLFLPFFMLLLQSYSLRPLRSRGSVGCRAFRLFRACGHTGHVTQYYTSFVQLFTCSLI